MLAKFVYFYNIYMIDAKTKIKSYRKNMTIVYCCIDITIVSALLEPLFNGC